MQKREIRAKIRTIIHHLNSADNAMSQIIHELDIDPVNGSNQSSAAGVQLNIFQQGITNLLTEAYYLINAAPGIAQEENRRLKPAKH